MGEKYSDFKLRGGALALWTGTEPEVILHGPAECVAGDTVFDGCDMTIREMAERGVRPVVQTLYGPELAEVPFLKGVAQTYRVMLDDGRYIDATARHLVMTSDGWKYVEELTVGRFIQCVDERFPIVSITKRAVEEFYDIHVPHAHHYFAHGILNHNTGKTRSVSEMLFWLAETWPGFRCLVVRKTRKSLSESFMNTFEEFVLPRDHPLKKKPIARSHREAYVFENGSRIMLGSLENPTAFFSLEADYVFCEECTEIQESDWEFFFRAIRYKTIPHPDGPDPKTGTPRYLNRLIGTCNPDSEHHWIMRRSKRRAADGKPMLRMIQSKHEDNPAFSEQSRQRLSRMTGVRYKRLALGQWCSAEGAVWENFSKDVHCKPDHPRDANGGLVYTWTVVGVDWGFTHPGCMSVWGVDPDGRMWRAWEVLRKGWTIDEWIKRAVELDKQWKPRAFVCDSADPGKIEQFRRAGLPAIAVQKKGDGSRDFVPLSLDLVRDRMKVQKDGLPRILFVDGACDSPDPELSGEGRPITTEDQIPGYVLRKDRTTGRLVEGEPDELSDQDAIDAMRYATCYVERYHQTGARGDVPSADYNEDTASTPTFMPPNELEVIEQARYNGDE